MTSFVLCCFKLDQLKNELIKILSIYCKILINCVSLSHHLYNTYFIINTKRINRDDWNDEQGLSRQLNLYRITMHSYPKQIYKVTFTNNNKIFSATLFCCCCFTSLLYIHTLELIFVLIYLLNVFLIYLHLF